MAVQFFEIDYRIQACEEYKSLWASFFKCFEDDIRKRSITPNDETAFEQIFTLLALKYWKFAELMDKDFSDSDRILKVLNDTVSLQNLKEVSEAQFSKIEIDWHTIFIDMNKTFGRLMAKRPMSKEQIKEQKRVKEEDAKKMSANIE